MARHVAELVATRRLPWIFHLARFMHLGPTQLEPEFVPLLRILKDRMPRHILEIGTAAGGSSYLLCRVSAADARIATVDLRPVSKELVASFARKRQQVFVLTGDSKSPAVLAAVDALFPEGLDLLFIDGDHTYDGVAADAAAFVPRLRAGGLVVFHDIVEDIGQRTGAPTPTGGWTGGVPDFWREFKAHHRLWQADELVESWDQDGFGLGLAMRPWSDVVLREASGC